MEIVANSNICRNIWIFYLINWIFAAGTIERRKLFKGGNYMRKYGMQGLVLVSTFKVGMYVGYFFALDLYSFLVEIYCKDLDNQVLQKTKSKIIMARVKFWPVLLHGFISRSRCSQINLVIRNKLVLRNHFPRPICQFTS